MITGKNTCLMTTEFEVKLKVLQLPEETPLLSAGVVGLVLHIHTAKEEVEIKKIKGRLENGKVNKKQCLLASK